MKIQTSSLNLQSAHHYSELYERKETLTITEKVKVKSDDKENNPLRHDSRSGPIHAGMVKNGYLADSGKIEIPKGDGKQLSTAEKVADNEEDLSIGDMKVRIMKMVLEQITGKRIDVYDGNEKSKEEGKPISDPSAQDELVPEREITTTYELNELYYEQESLSFDAVGQVTLESGETISFAASLSQQREFSQERSESFTTTGKLTDPLVVNFDGRGVRLTEEKVAFDLTGDGVDEQISNLDSGSSFLALDRDKDGKINSGNELFGPSTGSGFGELRELDSDRNGWIDENDALFYELRLWKPGHESSALLERGVGAISLDSVGGAFQLKDREQNLLGAVKNQGLWLHEKTGQAGFVQELDLFA